MFMKRGAKAGAQLYLEISVPSPNIFNAFEWGFLRNSWYNRTQIFNPASLLVVNVVRIYEKVKLIINYNKSSHKCPLATIPRSARKNIPFRNDRAPIGE